MFPFITLLHQREKKKEFFCFSFIQQFRSQASILETTICNLVPRARPHSPFPWGFPDERAQNIGISDVLPNIYVPPVRDPMGERYKISPQTL